MKQVYYTQEGQPYLIRVQSKRIVYDFNGIGESGALEVSINGAMANQSNARFRIDCDLIKPVIPIMCTYAAVSNNVSPILRWADVSSPYYSFHRSDFDTYNSSHLQALSKSAPMVDRIYQTDSEHYGYSMRYGQTVYSTADFIQPSGICGFKFKQFLADCFDTGATPIDLPTNVLLQDTQIGISFVYFELQTDEKQGLGKN